MADFGLKYRLRYETAFWKKDVKVDIEEKDYTGAGVMKKIGANHLKFNKEKNSATGKIRATSLEFSIQADTDLEYAPFYTDENGTYRVKLKIDDQVVWLGFIVCDQYSEDYVYPPYDVDILATDGLGLLKNYKFELTGMVTRFEAIRYCLEKIGRGLGYAFNIDLFESRMDTTRAMVDQLYFYGEIYGSTGKDYNCYEALDKLIPEGCIITQSGLRWVIQRETEPQKTRMLYDVDGNYEGTESGESLIQLGSMNGSDTDIYPIGNLTMNFEAAWNNFVISNQYGKRGSFLKNFDFSLEDGSYWVNHNVLKFYVKSIDDDYFGYIQGYETTQYQSYISQSVKVTATDSYFVFSVSLAIIAVGTNSSTSVSGNSASISGKLYFQIKLVGSSKTYYVDQKSGWTETVSYISTTITSETDINDIDWQSLKVILSKIPVDGIVTFTIYKYYATSFPRTISFGGICFTNVKLYTSELNALSDTNETDVYFTDSQSDSDQTITPFAVDLPEYENVGVFFKNGNYVDVDGEKEPASYWINNSEDAVRYSTYLAAFFATIYGLPKQLLSGTVRGENMHLNAYFQHLWNSERIYYVRTGTWNILEDTWEIEAVEILGTAVDHEVSEDPDPSWGLIATTLIEQAEAVFYRIYNGELINKYGSNATVLTGYIIFPELTTDIFDRSNSTYWSGLSIIDEDPRKWPLSELTNETIETYGTAATQARLFMNDYSTSASEILPIVEYADALSEEDQEDVSDYVSSNQTTSEDTITTTEEEHTEKGTLTNLEEKEITILFSKEYTSIPMPTHLKVYRWADILGNGYWKMQDVEWHFTSSSPISTTGCSLVIDDSEDIDGVIIDYKFE